MESGAITSYIDVAQVALYVFWLFFAGLIFYLRREDKREGYPLISDRSEHIPVQGFPEVPAPKKFLLAHPLETRRVERDVIASPTALWPGAPLQPTGNPLLDGIGPASYALRADLPDVTFDDGMPKIVPLRVATEFFIEPTGPDPRGMTVLGADKEVAGTIVDLWLDRSDVLIRYMEVELSVPKGARSVLIPMVFADISHSRRQVRVSAILASQFADVPALRNPDQVTSLEEDRIVGYYGGGAMYATPSRAEPLL